VKHNPGLTTVSKQLPSWKWS